MITIFLVEDNPFVVDALKGLIDTYPDLSIAAYARTAEAALTLLPEVNADVVLIDLALPGMNGIDLAAAIRRQWPDLPCIILSAHREEIYVKRALALGVRGYVTKERPLSVIEGIDRVLAGEVYLSEDLRGANKN